MDSENGDQHDDLTVLDTKQIFQNGNYKEIMADLGANPPDSDDVNIPGLGTNLLDLGSTADSQIRGDLLPDFDAVNGVPRNNSPASGSNLLVVGTENSEIHENLPVSVVGTENSEIHENLPVSGSNLPDSSAENGEIEQNLLVTDSNMPDFHVENSGFLKNFPVSDLNTRDFGPEDENRGFLAEIRSFTAANQDLVKEIGSIRATNGEMVQERELLEKELQSSSERAEALIAEIACLEEEKQRSEGAAASLVREVEALHAEKRDMEAEMRKDVAERNSMDASLTDSMEKLSLLGSHLDEKWAAMVAAQTRVYMICFEIERMQLEDEEQLKEVSLLNACNDGISAQVNHLQGEETALTKEIENFLTAKASAEQRAFDATAAITALRAEISKVTESDGSLQNQLNEARERIRYLEEQDHLMAARERDLETHILDLESKLHALRGDHSTTLQAFEQEKEAKAGLARTVEVAHTQINSREREIDSLKLSFDVQESGTNINKQRVQDLKSQESELLEQKQALATVNTDLEAVLRRLRSGSQEEQETKELDQLKEDNRRLGEALNEAKEKVRVSAEKELQLKSRVQELTVLANRKPMLAGLASPLILSSSTIVVLGVLVFLLHSKSR